jgi:hypothetical protein
MVDVQGVSWMHDFQPCLAVISDCLHCWVNVVKLIPAGGAGGCGDGDGDGGYA